MGWNSKQQVAKAFADFEKDWHCGIVVVVTFLDISSPGSMSRHQGHEPKADILAPGSRDQDRCLVTKVLSLRPRPWHRGLEPKTDILAPRSWDRDLVTKMLSPRPRSWLNELGSALESWIFLLEITALRLGLWTVQWSSASLWNNKYRLSLIDPRDKIVL